MRWIVAHPWWSFFIGWLALGCWVIGWVYAATPHPSRVPPALKTGSRWGKSDARE